MSLESNFKISPVMQRVLDRAKTAGLHKVAASLHGTKELTLKTAVTHMGTQLCFQQYRQTKIASGLKALEFLEKTGFILGPLAGAAGAYAANPEDPSYGKGVLGGIAGGLGGGLAGGMVHPGLGTLGSMAGGFALPYALLKEKEQAAAAAPQKMAGMNPMPTAMRPNVTGGSAARVQALKGLLKDMTSEGPQAFGGAVGGGGTANMFSRFDNAAQGVNPKATMRGSMLPTELPAIRSLPGRPL